MKLTSILALLTTTVATSVQARPNSPISERQALIAYIRFYGGNGCEEPWLEDTVFQQGDGCSTNSYAGPYGSFDVLNNSFTRTIRLFASPACSDAGNYIDVLPGQTGCFAGKISSYIFL